MFDLQTLSNIRRDAVSISQTTTSPAYMEMIDRLRIAGYKSIDIQSVMIYLVALELAGVVSASSNDKDMALQIFDVAADRARHTLKLFYEETPPT